MRFSEKIRQLFQLGGDGFYRRRIRRAAPDSRRRILIVRLDGIGDFFLWLPFAAAMRQFYRDAEVTLLANALWSDAAPALLSFDRVLSCEPVRFLHDNVYRRELLTQLRKTGFDLVLQPRFAREFLVEDQITRWCAAPHRVAWRSDARSINPRLMRWSDHWYSELLTLPAETPHEQEIARIFNERVTGQPQNDVFVMPERKTTLPDKWTGQSYFLVIPGAADPGRRWPPERLATVIQGLPSDLRPVICGSTADRSSSGRIAAAVPARDGLDLTGQTTLLQLLELIKGAQFLIGNDTGAMHMAARCGVPAVALLGGGQWGRFLPYPAGTSSAPMAVYRRMPCFGCNWKCRYARRPDDPYPCIAAIDPAMVLAAVDPSWQKPLRTSIL